MAKAAKKKEQQPGLAVGKGRIAPKKPKARVQRLLKKKEPQLVEGAKCALLLRGTKCPDELRRVLKDLVRASCGSMWKCVRTQGLESQIERSIDRSVVCLMANSPLPHRSTPTQPTRQSSSSPTPRC